MCVYVRVCVCVCACVRACICVCACTCSHERKFVLTVFWFFALYGLCAAVWKNRTQKRTFFYFFYLLFAGTGPISQRIFDRLEFKQSARYAVS